MGVSLWSSTGADACVDCAVWGSEPGVDTASNVVERDAVEETCMSIDGSGRDAHAEALGVVCSTI